MAKGSKTKGELRLLAIARDVAQPVADRAIALTDYARSRRTLPADLAALRRDLIADLARGQAQADIARLLEVDHARISRLLSQTRPEVGDVSA